MFGHLATKHSVSNLLALTLTGVAICTFFMGIIPSHAQIGILAPLLLILLKSIQGIFASGEHSLAALFVLEHVEDDKKCGKASSYYLCSTMAGTMLASLAATLVSRSLDPTFYWRIAYITGLLTAIAGIWLRITLQYKAPDLIDLSKNSFTSINLHKTTLIKVIVVNGFSFLTYTLPFVFLNSFIPLFTNIKTDELLAHNTILVTIDIMLLPIFGMFIDKFNYSKWMAIMSFLLTVTIIPLFLSLPNLDIMQITYVKFWILVIGVAFVAPLNAWLFQMIKGNIKYLINGFGYAVGTELLGRNIPVICLILWEYTHTLVAPALYIAFICLLTTIVLVIDVIYTKSKN